jgi:putative endonuclease
LNNEASIFWVYILENPAGRFYVGSSDDPNRREVEHNEPGRGHATFTHKNGPWHLVWREPHPTRASAVARERQIKRMKSARWIREQLLNGRVPTRRD